MNDQVPEETLVASNGRAELTLDQLAILHEGLGRFMLAASDRMRRCLHAAKAKNSRLARFQLSEAMKSLRLSELVRPQYTEAIEKFIEHDLVALDELLERDEWSEFDAMWEAMTNAVNDNHAEFNHGYLVWRVSQIPPEELVLEPQEQAPTP